MTKEGKGYNQSMFTTRTAILKAGVKLEFHLRI